MLDRSHSERIIKKALKLSSADHTEIMISGGKHALTRFANNGIIQNLIQKDYNLTVKATKDSKSGVATCNLFKGESLESTVEKACQIADLSAPDPGYLIPSGPQDYDYPDESYIEDTIDYTPRMRADLANRAIDKAKNKNCSASGTITTGDSMTCIANSQGLVAYHSKTESSFTLTITNPDDGTGWAEGTNQDVGELPIDNLAQKAVQISSLNKNRKKISSGKYKVLLDPEAVANMVMFLSYLGFSAQDYLEGRTFLCSDMGKKVTGENFSLYEDVYHEKTMGCPFDAMGMPKKAVTLIENGVAKAMVHDRKTAKEMKTESTGHATSISRGWGPVAANIRVPGGTTPKEDMLKALGDGLYIGNFFYDNVVDPLKTRITGMTKDGFFEVRDGKIVAALDRMRYNTSVLEAFANIAAMSKDTYTFDRGLTVSVPAMIINDLSLTD